MMLSHRATGGAKSHATIANMTGANPDVCWETGAAIGARQNGEAQRETYRGKVATYLVRGGATEDEAATLVGLEYVFTEPEAVEPVAIVEDDEDTDFYAGATVKDLRQAAKDAELTGLSKATRDELIEALDEHRMALPLA